MIKLSQNVSISEADLDISAIRSQGPGGQNVNKSATAIHLRFNIHASSLPDFYKQRLLSANHHLITAEGDVVIKAQEYRNQTLNRDAALKRLENLIRELTEIKKARRPTRPTLSSKKRRLESKKRNSTKKSLRGKVS